MIKLVMRVVFLNINYKYLKNRRKRIFNCHYFVNVRQEVFMATIAFLGLGQMGSPMATIYCKKGIHCRYLMSMHRPSCASYAGGHCGTNPSGSSSRREFIITMLPNGDIVRQVLLGEKASVRLFHLTRY